MPITIMGNFGKETAGARRHETIDYDPDGCTRGYSKLSTKNAVTISDGGAPLTALLCISHSIEDPAPGFPPVQVSVDAGNDVVAGSIRPGPLHIYNLGHQVRE